MRHRDRNGGGVAIYVRNSIAVKRLALLKLTGAEWIWCKVQGSTILVCTICIDVPPLHAELAEKLNESLALAQTYSPDSIIMLGDFNAGNTYLDSKLKNHSTILPYEILLRDTFWVSNMEQLFNEPTRYSDVNNTANLRDLVFVSNDNIISS